MKQLLYIICFLILLSCQSEEITPEQRTGTLKLHLCRGIQPKVQTRAIDNDLALKIVELNQTYSAGNVPNKINLEPGTYTLQAYTENQETWTTENEGKGSACYFGETSVTIMEDYITYCNYQVPMTNYAVKLTLPEMFNDLFKNYTFTLKNNGRSTTIKEDEKAYFDTAAGFSYKMEATNNDGEYKYHPFYDIDDVEAGKLFNIRYIYGSGNSSGGIDIEITDDMETEDSDVDLK